MPNKGPPMPATAEVGPNRGSRRSRSIPFAQRLDNCGAHRDLKGRLCGTCGEQPFGIFPVILFSLPYPDSLRAPPSSSWATPDRSGCRRELTQSRSQRIVVYALGVCSNAEAKRYDKWFGKKCGQTGCRRYLFGVLASHRAMLINARLNPTNGRPFHA